MVRFTSGFILFLDSGLVTSAPPIHLKSMKLCERGKRRAGLVAVDVVATTLAACTVMSEDTCPAHTRHVTICRGPQYQRGCLFPVVRW